MKHFFQFLKDAASIVFWFFFGLLCFFLWLFLYPFWFVYQVAKEAHIQRKARKDAKQ